MKVHLRKRILAGALLLAMVVADLPVMPGRVVEVQAAEGNTFEVGDVPKVNDAFTSQETTDSIWNVYNYDENNKPVLKDGNLQITSQSGTWFKDYEDSDSKGRGGNIENIYYQPANGDWENITSLMVMSEFSEIYQSAGIMIAESASEAGLDSDNYIHFRYEFGQKDNKKGHYIHVSEEKDGANVNGSEVTNTDYLGGSYTESRLYFKVKKLGNQYTFSISKDNVNYTKIKTITRDFEAPMFCLVACNEKSEKNIPIYYNFSNFENVEPKGLFRIDCETGKLTGADIHTYQSNGARVNNVGGPQNGAITCSVYASIAGERDMEIFYASEEKRTLLVDVNNGAQKIELENQKNSGDYKITIKDPDQLKTTVQLNKGWNTIRLSGVYPKYAQNLDYFKIELSGYEAETTLTKIIMDMPYMAGAGRWSYSQDYVWAVHDTIEDDGGNRFKNLYGREMIISDSLVNKTTVAYNTSEDSEVEKNRFKAIQTAWNDIKEKYNKEKENFQNGVAYANWNTVEAQYKTAADLFSNLSEDSTKENMGDFTIKASELESTLNNLIDVETLKTSLAKYKELNQIRTNLGAESLYDSTKWTSMNDIYAATLETYKKTTEDGDTYTTTANANEMTSFDEMMVFYEAALKPLLKDRFENLKGVCEKLQGNCEGYEIDFTEVEKQSETTSDILESGTETSAAAWDEAVNDYDKALQSVLTEYFNVKVNEKETNVDIHPVTDYDPDILAALNTAYADANKSFSKEGASAITIYDAVSIFSNKLATIKKLAFTVTFKSNGTVYKVESGITIHDHVKEPAQPTYANHYFLGWLYMGKMYNFEESEITQDIQLDAAWISNDLHKKYTDAIALVDNYSKGEYYTKASVVAPLSA